MCAGYLSFPLFSNMQTQIHPIMSSNPSPFSDLQCSPSPSPSASTFTAHAATSLLQPSTMENAVVVVSTKGCCMSHVVTRLLSSLGVNPHVVEVEMEPLLVDNNDGITPAVFIGGRLLGGVDRLLAAHITGSLVPQLKAAGALWL